MSFETMTETFWYVVCGVVYGMVWCGMWCGMVWYGVVWYGMWCGMVWYGVVWYGMVCGMVWCGMWCGVVWGGDGFDDTTLCCTELNCSILPPTCTGDVACVRDSVVWNDKFTGEVDTDSEIK